MKFNDSANENSQLQTIRETILPVVKQSSNISFFDPSFFKYTSETKDFFLSLHSPLNLERIPKN